MSKATFDSFFRDATYRQNANRPFHVTQSTQRFMIGNPYLISDPLTRIDSSSVSERTVYSLQRIANLCRLIQVPMDGIDGLFETVDILQMDQPFFYLVRVGSRIHSHLGNFFI